MTTKTHRGAVPAPLPMLLLLAAASWGLSGCSSDEHVYVDGGDGGVIAPAPTVLAGEWGTSATESLDSCGFDPLPAFEPMMIREAGADSVVFTFVDAAGFCQDSVRERTGDVVTLSKTDVFDAACGIVQVQSNIVYRFSETGFSGTSNHHYTTLAGFCSNLPCDYNLSVAGSRCDGCWPGCVYPSTKSSARAPAPAGDPSALGEPRRPF